MWIYWYIWITSLSVCNKIFNIFKTGVDYLKNPNVSFEEFANYFTNLSVLIEDDT